MVPTTKTLASIASARRSLRQSVVTTGLRIPTGPKVTPASIHSLTFQMPGSLRSKITPSGPENFNSPLT